MPVRPLRLLPACGKGRGGAGGERRAPAGCDVRARGIRHNSAESDRLPEQEILSHPRYASLKRPAIGARRPRLVT